MYAPAPASASHAGHQRHSDAGQHRRIRFLLVAYTVCAAITTAVLAINADRGFIGDLGLALYPLAAVGHALLAAFSSRPWVRPTLIVAELILVPVQFLLSIPSNLPLIGMLLSATLLVLLRPRFPKLSPRARKLFLWLHVGLSVSWLGLSLAMLVLSLTGQLADDRRLAHDAYRIMHVFDLVIVIPVVFLSIISGLVVSLGTKWGLIRYRWVLTKFLLSLTIPAVAGFQHLWISQLAERMSTPSTATPGGLGLTLTLCITGYATILWTTTALSVWKPWGKTRWGRRISAHSRGVA